MRLGLPGRRGPAVAAWHPMVGRRLAVGRSFAPERRRGARSVAATVCMADLFSAASAVPAVASSVAVAWGALMLTQSAGHASQIGEPCPACGGTGLETCFCSRWSDGDAGCQSCNHTGYMKCRSCGGGGTAVPIALTVRKDDSAGRPL
ncbi:unnamed protein product [Ostreobium quekettii]|uniref:Uncharacterized protein n=1 Tax=Ostreobium quekettii TaxID=121088 RepID=A0A8S1JE33_9CHLO|nr:unnamed protein product [Ostreobium quekettii]